MPFQRVELASVPMTQVNGVYCRNCAEVAAVKRDGPDALRPRAEPQRPENAPPRLGENRPAPPGSNVGTRLNVRA
jgi:hypothetical protein